jgi:cytoskeletal protein RodZ
MFTVCEVLQRARLDQGIDLATVAARTKIKAKYLQAIEAGDRKSLPGGFFYKSFVHQYATFLGVDTRAIDAEVDRVLSGDPPLQLPTAVRQTPVKLSSRSWTARTYFSYAALVVILVACARIDGWWHESRTVATKKNESRAPVLENTTRRTAASPATGRVSLAAVSQVAAGLATAAPLAAAVRQDEPAAPAGSIVELALTATEETWLSVSSDGTPVFSGVLEANQTKTIEGKEFAKLRVGNAAGLEVRLNGKPLGPLGAHGQVRDLAFTSDKFQFVSSLNESE